jgi:transposase-like protein
MRLSVRIPWIEPGAYQLPEICPYSGCDGHFFKPHQDGCPKPVRDPKHEMVEAQRWRCLRCGRTFRVYPKGVGQSQQTDALKALSVLLYVLGLSYGSVSDVLDALGWFLSKSTVYRNVQAAGQKVRKLRRVRFGQRSVPVMGVDTTQVRCAGEQATLAVAVNGLSGATISLEFIDSENAENVEAWLKELAKALGVEVLISDDADAYKTVADNLGLEHQVCRAHVNRNVARLVGTLAEKALNKPDPVPQGLDVTPEQLIEDLDYLQTEIALRPLDGAQKMGQLHERYQAAPPPDEGEKATMWYRTRLLTLDWWNNWPRLTLDKRWRGAQGECLDGTNNVSERAIGWWIKDRYRTMRGYKRQKSVLNVSHLTTWLGAHSGDYDLAELMAA